MGFCIIQGMKCDRPALDEDDEGLCLLHSNRADKDRDGAFTRAVKEQLARKDYNFRFVFFPGHISFEGHKFEKDTDFLFATFSGHAIFNNAILPGTPFLLGPTLAVLPFFRWPPLLRRLCSSVLPLMN